MAAPGQLQASLDMANSGLAGMMYQPPKDMGDYWRQILMYQMHLQGSSLGAGLGAPGASLPGLPSHLGSTPWPLSAAGLPAVPSSTALAAAAAATPAPMAPPALNKTHSSSMLHAPSQHCFSGVSEQAMFTTSPPHLEQPGHDIFAARGPFSQSGALPSFEATQHLLQQQGAASAGLWDAFSLMGLNPLLAAGLQGPNAATLQQQQQLAAAASMNTASSSLFSASSQHPTPTSAPVAPPSSTPLLPAMDPSLGLMASLAGSQLAASQLASCMPHHPLQPGSVHSTASGLHPAFAAAASKGPYLGLDGGAGLAAGALANSNANLMAAAAAATAGLMPPHLMLGSLMGSSRAALAMAGMGSMLGHSAMQGPQGPGFPGGLPGLNLPGPMPPPILSHGGAYSAALDAMQPLAPQASTSGADQQGHMSVLPPVATLPGVPTHGSSLPTPAINTAPNLTVPKPAGIATPFQQASQHSVPAAVQLQSEGQPAHAQALAGACAPPCVLSIPCPIQPPPAPHPTPRNATDTMQLQGGPVDVGSVPDSAGVRDVRSSNLAGSAGEATLIHHNSGSLEPGMLGGNDSGKQGRLRGSTSSRSVCKYAQQAGPQQKHKRGRSEDTEDESETSTADESEEERSTDDMDGTEKARGTGSAQQSKRQVQRRVTVPGTVPGGAPVPRITGPGWSSGPALVSCGSAGLHSSGGGGIGSDQGVDMAYEDGEDKQEKRKQSNRDSARRSRLRKQEEIQNVAEGVKKLEHENPQLTAQVARLTRSAEQLDASNAILRELLALAKQHRAANPGAVLPQEQIQPFLQRLQGCQQLAAGTYDSSPAGPSATTARDTTGLHESAGSRQPEDQLQDGTPARPIRSSARKRQASARQASQALPTSVGHDEDPVTVPSPPVPPAPLPPPAPINLSTAQASLSPPTLPPSTLRPAPPFVQHLDDPSPVAANTGRLAMRMGPGALHDFDPATAPSPPAVCRTDPCGMALYSTQANQLLHSTGKTRSEPGISMALQRFNSTDPMTATVAVCPSGLSGLEVPSIGPDMHASGQPAPPLLDGFESELGLGADCTAQPQPQPPAGFVPVDATSTMPAAPVFVSAAGQANPLPPSKPPPFVPVGGAMQPLQQSQPPISAAGTTAARLRVSKQQAAFMPFPLPTHSALSLGGQDSGAAGSGSSFAGPPMAFTPKMGLPAADYVGRQKAVAAAQAIAAAQAAAVARRLRRLKGQTVTAGMGGSLGSLQGLQVCSLPSAPGSNPAGFLASPATTQTTNPGSQGDASDGPEANVGTSAAPPAIAQGLETTPLTTTPPPGNDPLDMGTDTDRLLHDVQQWGRAMDTAQHPLLADQFTGSQGSWLGLSKPSAQPKAEHLLSASPSAANRESMPANASATLQLGQLGAGRQSSGDAVGSGRGGREDQQGLASMVPSWEPTQGGRSTTERYRASRQNDLKQEGGTSRAHPAKSKRRARSECSRSSQGSAGGVNQSESEGETAGSPMTRSEGSAGGAAGPMSGHHHHGPKAAQSGGRLELPQLHSQEHASSHPLQHGASSRVDLLIPNRSSLLAAPDQQPAASALLLCDTRMCNAGLGSTEDLPNGCDPLQLGPSGDGLEAGGFAGCFGTSDDQNGGAKGFLGLGSAGVDGVQTSGSEIDWSNILQDSAGRNAASSALDLPANMGCSGFAQSADPVADANVASVKEITQSHLHQPALV